MGVGYVAAAINTDLFGEKRLIEQ